MNKNNVRIKDKIFYIEDTNEEILIKTVRPTVQIKILFIWITIKEFNWYNKNVAYNQARKFYNCLTQQNYML